MKLKGKKVFLYLCVGLALTSMAMASDFPQTVDYEGTVVDAEGKALEGNYPASFRFYDKSGKVLFEESVDSLDVEIGTFTFRLGTGEITNGESYESLQAVFAAHPEVEFEVTLGDTTYGPRVGVLPAGHSVKSRLVAAGIRAEEDNDLHWKNYESRGGVTAFQSTLLAPVTAQSPTEAAAGFEVRRRPYVLPGVGPTLSLAVRDLPVQTEAVPLAEDEEINPPRHEQLFDEDGNRFGTVAPKVDDPLVAAASAPTGSTPGLIFEFEGMGISGFLPPDSEGAVGPNHYVQMVNSRTQVFDKLGNSVAGPFNTNTLWTGFGGACETFNNGDAIALYDEQADRWVLTQFAVEAGANSVCFAVSLTNDPTGTFYLYQFVTPRFPDYYKLGVWPAGSDSAYFMGTNSGDQGLYDVFALDRDNMLAGLAPRAMQFFQSFPNLIMPADSEGRTPPPAGSPGVLYSFRDGGESYFGSPPTDSIDIYEFDVDWDNSANSTFSMVQSLTPAGDGLAEFNWTVCGFFVQNCIPQPGTAQGLDSASWWPMQRLVYRVFDDHETLVGTWTVDVEPAGNRAAPRWFELRRSGGDWSIHQQGTYSPDAIHRWMPSIGIDSAGNIALGYSRGDGSNFASIYYATRSPNDALGTLQPEAVLWAGGGAQTHSAARWGDYSSMELDPTDECEFWYQNEYLQTTGSAPWKTRIGVFRIPGCNNFADGFETGDTDQWSSTQE